MAEFEPGAVNEADELAHLVAQQAPILARHRPSDTLNLLKVGFWFT